MNHLKFTKDKLNVQEISQLATSPKCGAISLFVGTTRDNFDNKTVVTLEYEAYESMAIKSMGNICKEIREKWNNIENIVIYHRLGLVPVMEASIGIAISSPHRQDAIQATEWCINTVKEKVPIWKKEIYSNNDSEWKENKESTHPPKLKKFKLNIEQKVEVPTVSPHLIQIKATNSDLYKRIENFMERKREEININNIREFCTVEKNSEFSCARIDAVLQKRKDSKGHLLVSKVLNSYHRDQFNSDYLLKYIPVNGIEERLQNLEMQLSLTTAIPKNIYSRLKRLEDRMLYLESISPEYINFWDKTHLRHKLANKKVFSIQEIDSLIADLEKKTSESKH